ncbi:FAD-linked oxidoreductase sorD [Fusarium oxysporum f. sp. cubense]|uniref:FAD-linked oxidoreductase sorD n=1 Tax=Fusarium oxysporum f. sp. cubense TaxID=61366 RepID=A0A559L843_FUSOC|nr:FAD-linked oxidoreductase sorD [Fusarium oxysporum f. sp. cubense]
MASLPKILSQDSEGYDQARRKFFNGRVPDIHPTEIAIPSTTAEVVTAVKRARENDWKIGVRSGGHLFFCNALLEGGLLIDTRNLNKDMEYDPATNIASVSPGHRVEDVTTFLEARSRFFPSGHSRSVAVGGFLLAGGQGCFMRGWGYTAPTWVTQLEVVTSEGETVIANKTQNSDLFWAAPGSGQGFFGVVTRIWVKTIPTRKLFDKTVIVDSTDIFKPLLKWTLEMSRKVPRYGVDLFYCTFFADKDDPNGGHESAAKRVFFAINLTIFADSLDEAAVLASPLETFPEDFKEYIVTTVPLVERTWDELWGLQESFQPQGNGERWNVDSILVDPKASDDELIDAITPALYDLPSRLSSGTLCPMDYYPSEADQALSLPQKAYVSTMCCWKDPKQDAAVDKWLLDAYTKADEVSCGVYVADFNVKHRKPKVMTDSALKKWLEIRSKWDPSETFIGHRGFSSVLDGKKALGSRL